jgi:hypothetical protein
MIYRPQFAYATPPGCRDQDFIYFFDGSNTPLLNQNFSGLDLSNPSGGIPLVLEQDTPFYWRGIKVGALRGVAASVTATYAAPNMTVRFKDNYENFLSDDMVPATEYGFPQNPMSINSSQLTGPPVPLDGDIYCPPGGVLWAYLKCPVLSEQDTWFPQLAFYGVKRFKECA